MQTIGRTSVVGVALISTILATIVLLKEMQWYGGQVLIGIALWLVPVYPIALIALRSKKVTRVWTCLKVAVVQMIVYSLYALGRSTDAHMYIIVVPPMLFWLSAVVFAICEYCFARNAGAEDVSASDNRDRT